MKYTTTYGRILRALTLLLALLLTLSCASLPAMAETETQAEDSLYMTWFYAPSTSVVNGHDPRTDTDYRYSPVTMMSTRIFFLPDNYFQYANTVEKHGKEQEITAPGFGSDFIVVDEQLMATNEGKKYLTSLAKAKSNFTEYRIKFNSLTGYMSEGFYDSIKKTNGATGEERSLFSLRDETCYTILGFGQDRWFGVPVAFIYELEDGLYFASALNLGEDCYDENGELLPKNNTYLSLYPLSEDLTSEAYRIINKISYRLPNYTYEARDSFWDNEDEGNITLAMVSTVILGIMLPIAPITLGLCLPHSSKMGRKKRWYLLAALGAAWLLLGILILVLTMISM